MLRGMAPRRQRFVVVIAAAVLVGATVGLTLGLRGHGSTRPVAADAPAGPVVLVPGYGGSTSGLDVLAGHLRAAGRDATVLPLPGDGTGDLTVQARALGALVVATLARTHAASVDLVGYSAGGVVVRIYVQEMGGAARVRRVVTLGSPHHGADLAATAAALVPGACTGACAQLEPGSALLAGLNARSLSPGPAYVSLYTADDRTVDPPTSAVLAGAVSVALQSVCAGVVISHGELPTSDLVSGIVLRELDGATITRPTAADCSALRAAG